MNFGVQIASFLFLITILISYFSHKRLPLQSTKFFTSFLIISLINLVFEMLTLVTINNDDLINTYLNRFTHQVFIGTINQIVVSLFLYIDLKCRKQKKYTKKELIIRLLPFIISLFFVFFGELDYNTTASVRYASGMMAYTIYICVFLYLVILIVDITIHKKNFTSFEIIAITMGVFSWASITFIQFLNPTFLLSSLAIVLMDQFLYMSFENQFKYLVENDGCVFSKSALELTVNEYINKKKKFYLVNYLISNYDSLALEIGYESIYSLINSYAKDLSKKIKGSLFLSRDNTITIVLEDINDFNKLTNSRSEIEKFNLNNIEYKLKILIKGVSSIDYAKFDDMILELENNDDNLTVYDDNKALVIKIKDILYVEVIDNQTFIYTKKNCYLSKDKLYMLEDVLEHWSFARISKSMLVNIQKIKSVAKESNSRLIAYLSNDESIIVSRQYVKDIKARLKI